MAEYCRGCSIRYLGPETAKYAGGLCKRGETTTMLCEGCGYIVDVDHEGRRVDKGAVMPDRDRWSGWVMFAWIIAAIACVSGLFLIFTIGFVDVPRSNSYGTISEPNPFVWALAISQAVGSVMLAVIFSMLRSIYQNTCDKLPLPAYETLGGDSSSAIDEGTNTKEDKSRSATGLKLTNVSSDSELCAVVYAGCLIISVNDKPVDSVSSVEALITKAPNKFEFLTTSGERMTKWVHVKPGRPIRIEGEPVSL